MPSMNLRAALALVEGHPAEVDALRAAEAASLAAAQADAKRLADRRTKAEAAVPARADALVRDYADLMGIPVPPAGRNAIRCAAEKLARLWLEFEHGLTDPRVFAASLPPARLTPRAVEREFAALADAAPLPWTKGATSDELRSAATRAGSAHVRPVEPPPTLAEERAAARRAERAAG